MALEAEIIQEHPYPLFVEWGMIEQWADGIPMFSENDPQKPEWLATPVFSVDLSSKGYGLIYIKDESHLPSNPTGTIKDRLAWELVTLYRDYARSLYLRKVHGLLQSEKRKLRVPRLCIITAGNMGISISYAFKKYLLPPIKLLGDLSLSGEILAYLKNLHVDIYLTDLSSKALSPEEIKQLTNNRNGIDISSLTSIEPQAVFYDWHVHEAFNEQPDEIYVPYGSGRLFENYITWQERSVRNEMSKKRDSRLAVPLEKIISLNIFGAEPQRSSSVADKLTKRYNPFRILEKSDIHALSQLSFSGSTSGVYKVSEKKIEEAYTILQRYCATEPSSAAGLALYLKRYEEHKINSQKKILIVNTGKGI